MIKRLFDFILSLLALVILSPILLLIVVLIKTKLGSPIFFRQMRPGLKAKPFELLKFRTMLNASDEPGSDEQRMTKFGLFLRSTSLDELPQLWNVLKGEMSLVGPRPLLMEYLSLYTPTQNMRHEVRPGLTGWAQVNGRNAISWEEKFDLDLWYVHHQHFWLDLKVIFLTIWGVIGRKDIQSKAHVTAEKFTGNSQL